jgi:hypothetical protein
LAFLLIIDPTLALPGALHKHRFARRGGDDPLRPISAGDS